MVNPLRAVLAVPGVLSKEKSFRRNPIIGSERLNKWGLHRKRVKAAANLAAMRRKRMSHKIDPQDRAFFDENGFFFKTDFLPQETLEALKKEVFGRPIHVREMTQGQAITRITPLAGSGMATGVGIATDPSIRNYMSYAAGRAGEPIICLESIVVNSAISASDPQTMLHSDTFHSTSKMWLFLNDVGEEDGPFAYSPGSNRLTEERINWEYEQSLTAVADNKSHHSDGSFRIDEARLSDLGYQKPRRMTVKANTLVVADTYGFHRRSASTRPTTRVEVYGYLRRNPFMPWNDLDPAGFPGLRGRQVDVFFRYLNAYEKFTGRSKKWKDAGVKEITDPRAGIVSAAVGG
ncbi:MAG: phytanoyl-CoA dioxygenase [Pseudomonadota bacterium]